MLCLRICGAYSYRLTRRHSTIVMLASFIFFITLVLHLYAYRHHEVHTPPRVIGDYVYKPGSFLKDLQPNENETYCHFNYGLPEHLNWNLVKPSLTPERGIKSPFRVIYNAIKGTAYENASKHHEAVTYATQATPEFLYHIVEIARYWDGPISLSVFVPNYDLDITIQIMNHLCRCYPGMAKVSLHLFYNKNIPPMILREVPITTEAPTANPTNETVEDILRRKKENYRNLNNQTRAAYVENSIKNKIKRMMVMMPKMREAAPVLSFQDCSGLWSYDLPTFRQLRHLYYPINVGRNTARFAATTTYFIVSDIEMVPSEGLATKFVQMLKKRDVTWIVPKTVFVVPVFEVTEGEHIPRQKEELVNLIQDNRAMYFHERVCIHCQRFPGLQSWLTTTPSDKAVEPFLIVRREFPYHRWEPIYFGTNREPWYSELLTWEGQQDKMTQMLELCLLEYDFEILDGVFLVHTKYRPVLKLIKNDKRKFYHNAYVMNSYAFFYNYLKFRLKYSKYVDTYPKTKDQKKCVMNYKMGNIETYF